MLCECVAYCVYRSIGGSVPRVTSFNRGVPLGRGKRLHSTSNNSKQIVSILLDIKFRIGQVPPDTLAINCFLQT